MQRMDGFGRCDSYKALMDQPIGWLEIDRSLSPRSRHLIGDTSTLRLLAMVAAIAQ